ncbi:hypothetical protein BDQ17DRAFT_1309570 [Cyathus striatus]|nr:hypothetical protein BDQ17DRAFT_1309570 [Cyathus striatus]
MPGTTPPASKKFFLFGYPIAHSFAPALHNLCFDAWEMEAANRYELYSTSKVTEEVLEVLRSEECGGAAVTMPIKASILPFLNEISHESKVTCACNTIIKVPTSAGVKFVGQNTDILGVLNTLLRALRSQHPYTSLPPTVSYPDSLRAAGMVIGGGATTRSAAYALTLLGLSPIYLINRDDAEIREIQDSMPHIRFMHLRSPKDVAGELGRGEVTVVMAVGAIPAIPPVTKEEKMVYAVASAVFSLPYNLPLSDTGSIPLPKKRIFLEMPYKPRNTPMLQLAKWKGWDGVDGIQAMIEQGLAQQRMWYTSTPTLAIGSDTSVLSFSVERAARALCENMPEVVVDGVEIDRATRSCGVYKL